MQWDTGSADYRQGNGLLFTPRGANPQGIGLVSAVCRIETERNRVYANGSWN